MHWLFRDMGEREGAVIPLNLLRGYTDSLCAHPLEDASQFKGGRHKGAGEHLPFSQPNSA